MGRGETRAPHPSRLLLLVALIVGLTSMIAGAWLLIAPFRTIGRVERVTLGGIPATVFLPQGEERGPAVVIAHGFAGSRQIMEAFALALAQGGYRAITFDFPGHGQNTRPLAGGLEDRERRYAQLAAALDVVVGYAGDRFGGPVGLLGHSMGSEAVTRYAQTHPAIAATVAVSLVYEGVTATSPRNLLVLTGAWEPGLIPIAQAVADEAAGGTGATGVTYGSFAEGTARRVVLVPWAEHIAVLFSGVSLAESYAWFQAAMPAGGGTAGPGFASVERRLPGLGLIFVGATLLFWPLAALMQPIGPLLREADPLGRRVWWAIAVGPALLTPPLLLLAPTRGLLPILVGGPLALFFAIYGLLTLAGLGLAGLRRSPGAGEERLSFGQRLGRWRRGTLMALAVALLAVGYVFLSNGLPLHLCVLNYFPPAPRWPVFLAVLAAMLPYFLADEALTRRPGAPRGAYLLTKLCFLLALVAAIALNPRGLFFLVLIAPLVLPFYAIYGLLSTLMLRRTGTIVPGALANSAIFAWVVAATFPLVVV